MINKKLFFILLCLNISCSKKILYTNEDGILFEINNDTLINKYNFDNKIYTVGKRFYFNYTYNKDGINYYCEFLDEKWSLIKHDSSNNPNIVKQIVLEIADGNPMTKYMPDYNQTVIKYSYPPFENYNMTGLVENKENIWMHPPRKSLFRILELNPFPYIKYPLKVGKKWNWKLRIGSKWGDKRWKTFDETITNHITYEVTDYKLINTEFGNINCYVIESIATNEIGTTHLKILFNDRYGFVKLNYINIDGSTINLTLSKVEF